MGSHPRKGGARPIDSLPESTFGRTRSFALVAIGHRNFSHDQFIVVLLAMGQIMQKPRQNCFDYRADIRHLVYAWLSFICSPSLELLRYIKKSRHLRIVASLEKKHEIEIMYFGQASDCLQMTSERMVVPDETFTLEEVLNRLRERGDRWTNELDERHVVCTINGKVASSSTSITVGMEIGIFSIKSNFGI